LLPYSTYKERRSTCHGLCLPATFRPQGLATLSTAFSLRTRAGSVSRRQRSWDSPFGAFPSRKAFATFPKRIRPPTVFPADDAPTWRRRQTGRPRFLGVHPPESPWPSPAFLARPTLAAPLGFTLPGPSPEDLAGFSPGLLSRAYRKPIPRPRPHLRVSIGLRLAPSATNVNTPGGSGDPHRVSAPVRS
jgi:hypothetical protein